MTEVTLDNKLPLAGRRVLVTRALQQAGKLSDGLKALGAEPVEVPVLEIRPPDSFEPLDKALRKLEAHSADAYHWLILTSANTVNTVAARCSLLGIDVSGIKLLSVAAVGSATAEAARKAGFRVTLVPDSYHSEGLVAAFGNSVAGKRVLLARAKVARDVIPTELRRAGAHVDVIEAYETVIPQSSRTSLQAVFKNPRRRPHVVTFTSSSTVKNFVDLIESPRPRTAKSRARLLQGIRMASIGPVTSQTLRDLSLPVDIAAKQFTIPGLVQAIVKSLA